MDAVLFDMFGVIARVHSPESQAELEVYGRGRRRRVLGGLLVIASPYDRGDVSATTYWKGVADLVAVDLKSWSDVDQECVDFIGELSQRGVKLGLLSNIPEESSPSTTSALTLGSSTSLSLGSPVASAELNRSRAPMSSAATNWSSLPPKSC